MLFAVLQAPAHSKHVQNSSGPKIFFLLKIFFFCFHLATNDHSHPTLGWRNSQNCCSCKIPQPKHPSSKKKKYYVWPDQLLATVHIYGLRRLTTVPWFQIKGWRKHHFSACCEIGIAFPEKVHQSSFLGFKGFLEINTVSNLNISQGIDEKVHKRAQELFSVRVANVAVLVPKDDCSNVITPETHAHHEFCHFAAHFIFF